MPINIDHLIILSYQSDDFARYSSLDQSYVGSLILVNVLTQILVKSN